MSRTGLSRAIAAFVLSLTVGAAPALAATITFNFGDFTAYPAAGSAGAAGDGSVGNVRSFTSGGLTVYATAWYITSSNDNFAKAGVGRYSGAGLGVCNGAEADDNSPLDCGSGAHAVDNVGQNDFLLFLFNSSVDFQSALLNDCCDADVDATYYLGNYTGAIPNSEILTNVDIDDLDLGPRFFGSAINDDQDGGNNTVTNAAVGFHNALLIGARAGQENDRFKLLSLTVNTPEQLIQTPEPGTIALLGLGLAGLAIARRRQARK